MSCQKCHRFVCKCEPTIVIAAAPVAPEGRDDPYRTLLAKELHEAITEGRRTCERALAVLAEQPATSPLVQHGELSEVAKIAVSNIDKTLEGSTLAAYPFPTYAVSRGWLRTFRLAIIEAAKASPAVDAGAPYQQTIPGDGLFGGIKVMVDPSLPPDTIEMRGANRVRLNLTTGQISTAPASPAAAEVTGVDRRAAHVQAGQFGASRPQAEDGDGRACNYIYPTKGDIEADVANETTAVNVAVGVMADALESCPLKDSLKVYAAIELAFRYGDRSYVEEVFSEVMIVLGLGGNGDADD